MVNDWQFKLLYDGECPMCRREANWLMRRNRAGHLAFEDISAPEFDPSRYGLTQDQVKGVMHGVFPDGRIVTKVAAFREAYRQVGLGWLLAPTAWPGVRAVADELEGDAFVDELAAFPAGKHDDQVDAASLIGRVFDRLGGLARDRAAYAQTNDTFG